MTPANGLEPQSRLIQGLVDPPGDADPPGRAMAWMRAAMFRASPKYSPPDMVNAPWSMSIRKRVLRELAWVAFLASISVVMAMAVRIAPMAPAKTAMQLSPTKLTRIVQPAPGIPRRRRPVGRGPRWFDGVRFVSRFAASPAA